MSKQPKSKFFCPLGYNILWWHDLIYKECPMEPSYRDMPECKDCKLRVDKKWESNKEAWKDIPAKKKKKPFRKNKKYTKR